MTKQAIRYLFVGLLNTLIGASIMFLFYNLLHFSYFISSAANYGLGGIVSYFTHKNITFKNKEKSPWFLPMFILVTVVCYAIAYGLAKPLAHSLLENFSVSLRDNIAMVIGMGLYGILNFFGQRLIFTRR